MRWNVVPSRRVNHSCGTWDAATHIPRIRTVIVCQNGTLADKSLRWPWVIRAGWIERYDAFHRTATTRRPPHGGGPTWRKGGSLPDDRRSSCRRLVVTGRPPSRPDRHKAGGDLVIRATGCRLALPERRWLRRLDRVRSRPSGSDDASPRSGSPVPRPIACPSRDRSAARRRSGPSWGRPWYRSPSSG